MRKLQRFFVYFLTILPLNAALIDVIPSKRIDDDKVHLGDLFTGVEGHTQKVVGKAPIPGESKVYIFGELMDIAKKFGIKWNPLLDTTQAVVLRASFRMDQHKLHTLIWDALKEKYPKLFSDEKIGIALTLGKNDIYIPKEKKIDIATGEISLNDQKTRFTIEIKTPYKTYTVEGHLVDQRQVPVLRKALRRGAVINPLDTELMAVPVKDIGRTQIIDRSEVLGKTIKVGEVRAFKPIYEHEVAWQFMVRKGDTLRMFARQNDTHEAIPGTALTGGVRDDVILVRNGNTGDIQEAHIVSQSEVHLLKTPPARTVKKIQHEQALIPKEEELLL